MANKLNLARLRLYRPNWNWSEMKGSRECITWCYKDLFNLDEALLLTRGRDTVVQAGGNLGIFPKRLAEEFKRVFTFEPHPKLFSHLQHNAPELNITPIQAALGDSHASVSLDCRRRDGTDRPIHEGMTFIAGPGDIPQMRIDDLRLRSCDLIYLDIEGYEFKALLGAVETIKTFRPVIAIEVNSNINQYESNKGELRSWVEGLGYVRALRRHGDDIYIPEEHEDKSYI